MANYRAGVSARVRDVIADELSYTEIREDMELGKDVGRDSMDQWWIKFALQDEFGIEIYDDDWEPAVDGTVGDVVDLIVRLTQ